MYVVRDPKTKPLGEAPVRRPLWQDVFALVVAGIAAELLVDAIKGAKRRL